MQTELRDALAEDATVEQTLIADERVTAVSITPRRRDALAVDWMEMGHDELLVQAGHIGGRWELGFTHDDVDFIEAVTRSVIAGRVVETFGWRRSRVKITLPDGRIARETGGESFLSLIPLAGWPRLGRRIHYSPYRWEPCADASPDGNTVADRHGVS